MRFTRLRLNGFKSFVDPTDLVISDGLTGVVGPNGCGKSNLLEALRWVMGENRPTAMRGAGMDDVIFAGAARRPARSFAEVVLVLDNSERLAPAGFNDGDLLEISRRITRDAGSAYKLNTKDVRARDVQMLFADASTGAQSPALVRQGQIVELISAKPKARRRILEEAAGISGLYQRRHEAELKLRGAEANLLRVDDVVEKLAAQLAQLARQARQAGRYREIGAALRQAEGVLLYRRWREADRLHAETEAALAAIRSEAATAEARARQHAERRDAAEAALPALREEEAIAAAMLRKLAGRHAALIEQREQARRTVRSLGGQIEQMDRDAARETALNTDADETIAALRAEAAALASAEAGHEGRLASATTQAREAADILALREADLSQVTEDIARLAARHQSATRMVADAGRAVERAEGAAAKARSETGPAEATLAAATEAVARATGQQQTAIAMAGHAETSLQEADAARGQAQRDEAEARAARSEAEGEHGAIRAEANALARLVARDTGDGGQLLDAVKVAPGFEAALGAALADDLRMPVLDDAGVGSGWATLPGYDADQPLPEGAVPLADHVTIPPALARRIAQVGLVDPAEGQRLQPRLLPGQRLVSRDGDLWRWDGLCAGAKDSPTAAALRLQQLNRLAQLEEEMAALTARLEASIRNHEDRRAWLDRQTEADRDARATRKEADAAVTAAARALTKAEADRDFARSRLDGLRQSLTRQDDEAMAARTALAEAKAAEAALDDLPALRAQGEDVRMTLEEARMTMMSKRSAADEIRRDGEGRRARAEAIARDLASWTGRRDNAGKRMAELDARRDSARARMNEAEAVPGRLEAEFQRITADLAGAEQRHAAAAAALTAGDAGVREVAEAERDAERNAGAAREARATAEARDQAARQAAADAAERIVETLDMTPAELLASLGIRPDDLPPMAETEREIADLRRKRDGLGAVNLRAEEDAREVQEEHDTLLHEKADLEAAIGALRSGISGLNREGRERLLAAFTQVNENFSMLFRHLFGGGEARLELVESDDPLDAGLEIMCQPPGKKLSTLSLLSGGEQTLTALALIFAVFLANPAPICVLDEVDAPLDDANVTRFCDMLDEMTRRTDTRFLVITHHAVTMARMDRLFGVTMAEQGVSQLVSVDLRKAEQMVA